MFFANKTISAIISIPKKDKLEYQEMKAKLFQWAETHLDDIAGRYVIDSNRIIVTAKKRAFIDLPKFAMWEKYNPKPVKGLFADMSHHSYMYKGETVLGSKHFAPEASLYVFAPHSGDGYERTYMVGLQRDSHRFISVIAPTKRLINWRIEHAQNPAMIYAITNGPGHSWESFSNKKMESFVKVMNERNAQDR